MKGMALAAIAAGCQAARLTPAAKQEFDCYVTALETRIAHQRPAAESVSGESRSLPGALLHHWRGAMFVPGAHRTDMLRLLRDYNHFAQYYAPEVESSRELSESGEIATVAMRLRYQKAITVVLDAQYEVRTGLASDRCGYGWSRSTPIWRVDEPGTAQERRRPEGDDDGFLWRLNSYWAFCEASNGLFIELQAVSLTRDIPFGLRWIVKPIIENLPRESLEFTLAATRSAVQQ